MWIWRGNGRLQAEPNRVARPFGIVGSPGLLRGSVLGDPDDQAGGFEDDPVAITQHELPGLEPALMA
jgi:hypothetical protein